MFWRFLPLSCINKCLPQTSSCCEPRSIYNACLYYLPGSFWPGHLLFLTPPPELQIHKAIFRFVSFHEAQGLGHHLTTCHVLEGCQDKCVGLHSGRDPVSGALMRNIPCSTWLLTTGSFHDCIVSSQQFFGSNWWVDTQPTGKLWPRMENGQWFNALRKIIRWYLAGR